LKLSLQPAYLLHSRPYRDTSLLLEAWSRDAGRVGLVAKGARGVRSRLRGLLQPFVPLLLSWSGRGELATLTGAEADGPCPALVGRALLSGLYVNELLLRLVPRNDPHPRLFALYGATLPVLADPHQEERALRLLERDLLEELGYGLVLDHEADTGLPVAPQRRYRYLLERGVVAAESDEPGGIPVSGASLLALARGELRDRVGLKEAKELTRAALALYLGGRPLKSRELFAAFASLRRDER
jgi:DNA repair protein RecO (recombination protein O)